MESVYIEEKLKESRRGFQSLFNLMPDPVVIVDGKGKFLAVNDRVEEISGFKREELLGKNFLRTRIVTAKGKAILIKNLAKRMMGMHIEPYEIEALTKDGRKLPFEVNARKIEYSGKPADLVIFRDLRERKRVEKALRESEEKFRLAFENAKDAIFWADPTTGFIINCNKAAETLLEKKRGEIIGRHQTTLHPPQKAEYYAQMFKRHIEQEGTVDDEAEVITRSGKIKPVHITASRTLVGGKPVIQGIFRDITERKKVEDALRESEERWRSLVELAPDAIVTLNMKGVITSCNTATVRQSGYSKEELVGKHFSKLGLLRARDIPKLLMLFSSAVRGKVPKPFEVNSRRKDGTPYLVEVRFGLVKEGGKTIGFQAISRDITERKAMERKLQEYSEHLQEMVEERTRELKEAQERLLKSERLAAIGELASMVSHDLRNPLQAITNAIYVLKDWGKKVDSAIAGFSARYARTRQVVTELAEERIKMFRVIDESVKYANKIVSDLQDFARIPEPRLVEVDLESLIQEALSDISIPENVRVSIRYEQALSQLYVDPTHIRRVFMNLTTNAVEGMPNGGELTISTSLKDGFASIAFQDTGVGIPKENIEKLFTPLFTTKAKGVGLGLAICKNLVEAHGGNIEVESEERKGSTFTVKLPIQQDNGGEKLNEG